MKERNIKIVRAGGRSLLRIEKESVEISDYRTQSSADGLTELWVCIKGISNEFEMSANLREQMR